jgi:CheY-like chemotaxis protein
MLSANAMAEHQEEARAAGADLHVAKPITAASLLAGIDAALTPPAAA